ncbi:MAG: ATP synthase F0 subunit C [Bacteroidales bacterium]|nr:ATP synthase F0 subunit C [Bacteroidales bacterium]
MLLTTLLQAGVSFAAVGKTIGAAGVAFAAALGIGKIGKAALEAGARQPEQAGHYRMTAIITGALVEGACLFALVICLLTK